MHCPKLIVVEVKPALLSVGYIYIIHLIQVAYMFNKKSLVVLKMAMIYTDIYCLITMCGV